MIIVTIVIMTIGFTVILGALSLTPKYVNDQTLTEYGDQILKNYASDISFYLPSTRNEFTFYSNRSYKIETVISSIHGVALLIDPSNERVVQNIHTNKTMEQELFGGDLTLFPAINVPDGCINSTWYDFNVNTNNHPFVQVEGNGIILFKNFTVNGIHYASLFLRGNNESKYWTKQMAEIDSDALFRQDLREALNNSEEVRQRYAEPELDAQLTTIINKLNETNYSYLQFKEDFQVVENLARTKYGIVNASQFVNETFDFLKNKTAPTSKTVFGINDPQNWVFSFVCGLEPPVVYAVYLASDYVYAKYNIKKLGVTLSVIVGAVLLQGVISSVYSYPNDFKWFGIQPVVIMIMWLIGFLFLERSRKRVGKWLSARSTSKQKPN